MSDTPYSVEKTRREQYPHMVSISLKGETFVFVGRVFPLTSVRKANMVLHVVTALGLAPELISATTFDRSPFLKDSGVTLTWETVTENATGNARDVVSYSHTMGGGSYDGGERFYLITL